MPGHDRLLARRARRAADQLLFVAADLPDLLRASRAGQRPSISSTRSTAIMTTPGRGAWRQRPRRTACTVGKGPAAIIRTKARSRCSSRSACSRSARCSPGQLFHGMFVEPESAPNSGAAASRSASILPHAVHEVPLWVKLHADDRDADRPVDRLAQLHPRARARRRASSRRSRASTASSPTNGISTSSTMSSSSARRCGSAGLFWKRRRRRHDRPLRPARRGLCGRRRQPDHRAAAVGLSLSATRW